MCKAVKHEWTSEKSKVATFVNKASRTIPIVKTLPLGAAHLLIHVRDGLVIPRRSESPDVSA